MLHGLAVCAGFGGIELGLRLALGDAYRTVCVVEREAFAAAGLVALMEAGYLDQAPVWDDLTTFDGCPWRGTVDLVSAGLPCQPYSVAGQRHGHADDRAIWPHFVRLVRQVRPALVFLENVAPFAAWYRPLGDRLSRLGYEYQAGLFRAAEVGAPHRRERLFVLAYTRCDGWARGRAQHDEHARQHVPHVDRCDPALADACGARRSAVARGTPGDEEPDEGWTTTRDHEPDGPREGVGHTRPGQRLVPDLSHPGGPGARTSRAPVGDAAGLLQCNEPTARPGAAGSPSGMLVDASGDRWREGRTAAALGFGGKATAVAGMGVGDADGTRLAERRAAPEPDTQPPAWPPGPTDHDAWRDVLVVRPDLAPAIERRVLRMVDRMAHRVDRLRGIGNGVVPLVAAHAFCTLAAQAGLRLDQFAPWLRNEHDHQ